MLELMGALSYIIGRAAKFLDLEKKVPYYVTLPIDFGLKKELNGLKPVHLRLNLCAETRNLKLLAIIL
jgi:hypothetical protein